MRGAAQAAAVALRRLASCRRCNPCPLRRLLGLNQSDDLLDLRRARPRLACRIFEGRGGKDGRRSAGSRRTSCVRFLANGALTGGASEMPEPASSSPIPACCVGASVSRGSLPSSPISNCAGEKEGEGVEGLRVMRRARGGGSGASRGRRGRADLAGDEAIASEGEAAIDPHAVLVHAVDEHDEGKGHREGHRPAAHAGDEEGGVQVRGEGGWHGETTSAWPSAVGPRGRRRGARRA